MIDYRIEHDFSPMVDDVARRITHNVDQAALDKAAMTLERFGYVKVVRCRDCEYTCHFWHHNDERWQCAHEMLDGLDVSPGFFCAWGKRKEK